VQIIGPPVSPGYTVREPTTAERACHASLIGLGVVCAFSYFRWWLHTPLNAIGHAAMAGTLAFHMLQLFIPWGLALKARRRQPPTAGGISVDVFVVAYDESTALVARTLEAAIAMRGPHTTYLLDDGRRSELRTLARRLGACYVRRSGNRDAKAGSVTRALRRTRGDVVAIFDADHVPRPEFLEQTLGYFEDPTVGFVQVMLTFSNGADSFIARAAAEMSGPFFNVTSLGMDRCAAATLFGSNALIRRRALMEIGGYAPGLAEDLATSVALHAAGWKSAYVGRPLAPGLSPLDLQSFFKQQLKWSRGVFEVLFAQYPQAAPKLSLSQNLSYLTRMTHYLSGLYVALHFAFCWWLLFGNPANHALFATYILRYLPLFAASIAVQMFGEYIWTGRWGLKWRAASLATATWPVYVLAAACTVARVQVRYLPTPKDFARGNYLPLVLPQMTAIGITIAGIVHLARAAGLTSSGMLVHGFALVLVAMHLSLLPAVGDGLQSGGSVPAPSAEPL
jgi:cellulose synthase (UDP-forming)